jgi:hypothetical protein
MLRARTLLPMALFVVVLALLCAAPGFAAETAGSPASAQPAVAPAAPPAGCGLSLAPLLSQGVQGETCKQAEPASQVPDFMTSNRKGYCHCGCSSVRTCKTSDDCGGASCDPFPSCC